MISRNIISMLVVAGIAFGAGAGIGILGFTWIVGGDGEASEPISAPTLDPNARATLSPAQVDAVLTQSAQLRTQLRDSQGTLSALEAGDSAPQPTPTPTPAP